ncbi:branched-chain amino acid ABC transporter permease [Bradyrhizobium sp. CCGB12]|uniref:branched-chain amino acid ABC transporter permease n=1 Tax=Bradyrhizobium sp. CCGB12 TaxID=2949632 RepID=UPI0020B2D1E8|nr:branched-chain amino acid ABC transporter permease [Bradyrhizobium sp. CCGB12]MCP3387789.1 branched-chain amino acid ABC transporter permease [Bradyrhizobium sp. CCGB12]
MNIDIFLILAQDGLVNAAVYALAAIALVLVYAVTRIVFVPQGEFVAYGALTFAGLLAGVVPMTVWLMLAGSVLLSTVDIWKAYRGGVPSKVLGKALSEILYALAVAFVAWRFAPGGMSQLLAIPLTLAIMIPLGPQIYRLAFEPIAGASVLMLLIVATAVHFVMVGVGLLAFGAEGSRNPPVADFSMNWGPVLVTAQSVWVIVASLAGIVALWLFFGFTLRGRALRAVAVNRIGAKLVGIRGKHAGRLTFALAAAIGTSCGILISPVTTIYYDTGFLIGLKGFVAAIIGGLASYPLAAVGALLVGILESYSSFWASAYKEVIVFTLIIPVLLWRSLRGIHFEEE